MDKLELVNSYRANQSFTFFIRRADRKLSALYKVGYVTQADSAKTGYFWLSEKFVWLTWKR